MSTFSNLNLGNLFTATKAELDAEQQELICMKVAVEGAQQIALGHADLAKMKANYDADRATLLHSLKVQQATRRANAQAALRDAVTVDARKFNFSQLMSAVVSSDTANDAKVIDEAVAALDADYTKKVAVVTNRIAAVQAVVTAFAGDAPDAA